MIIYHKSMPTFYNYKKIYRLNPFFVKVANFNSTNVEYICEFHILKKLLDLANIHTCQPNLERYVKYSKNKYSKPAIGHCFSVIFIAAMGKIHAGNVHPGVNHVDQVVSGL